MGDVVSVVVAATAAYAFFGNSNQKEPALQRDTTPAAFPARAAFTYTQPPAQESGDDMDNGFREERRQPSSPVSSARPRAVPQPKPSPVDMVFDYFRHKTELDIVQEICVNLLDKRVETIQQGKRALRGVYINIFDYVEECKKAECFRNFRILHSLDELKARCQERHRLRIGGYFPLQRAKDEGFAIFLKVVSS